MRVVENSRRSARTVPSHQIQKGIAPRRLILYGCQKLNKLKSLRYTCRFPEKFRFGVGYKRILYTTAQFIVHNNADTTLDCVSSRFISKKNKMKLQTMFYISSCLVLLV